MKVQLVFSHMSWTTGRKGTQLSMSLEDVLPNGSSSSQTLRLGTLFGLLEVQGARGLTFKYCLWFSVCSTKFSLKSHFFGFASWHYIIDIYTTFQFPFFLYRIWLPESYVLQRESLGDIQNRACMFTHLLKLHTPWALCKN